MTSTSEETKRDPEATERYFTELAINLKREGLVVLPAENSILPVELDGERLCSVTGSGGVRYQYRDKRDEGQQAALDKVIDIAKTTAGYMSLMEAAPSLKPGRLEGDYRLLAEFNGMVLAGHPTEYGIQFITWEQIHAGTALYQGHYFGPDCGTKDYAAAKQDFALRSGLLPRSAIFTPEQLAEVCRSINATLENDIITSERQKLLESAVEQIGRAVPDLEARVQLSCEKEMEFCTADAPEQGGMSFC